MSAEFGISTREWPEIQEKGHCWSPKNVTGFRVHVTLFPMTYFPKNVTWFPKNVTQFSKNITWFPKINDKTFDKKVLRNVTGDQVC